MKIKLPEIELRILLIFLLIFASALVFIVIGSFVSTGSTQEFDDMIIKSLRDPVSYESKGPSWLSETMRDITSLGGGSVLILLTLSVLVFLLLQKQYLGIALVLISVIGGVLIEMGLKEFFARERPDSALHLMTVQSLSFPSGHSMMSVVVYLSLAALLTRIQKRRRMRIYIIAVALFLSFIIGLSRIYLGVHYPTDVLAGWSVGLAWAVLCWFAAWYIQQKRHAVPPNLE